MAFKFNCEHCGEELLVYYLKKGEEAQCTACGKQTTVLETAEFLDLGRRPTPQSRLSLPIKEDEERRREITREEIAKSASVRIVKTVLDVSWYVCLVALVGTFLMPVLCGPNSTFYNFNHEYSIDIDGEILWEQPLGLGDNDSLCNISKPVIVGHKQAMIRIPGSISAAPILFEKSFYLILALIVIFLLRRVFRRIRAGNPFDRSNAANLKLLGYIVAISGPVWGTFKALQATDYLFDVEIAGACTGVALDLHLVMVFIGLVIVAIAHLFELAARIQREQDLTI